MSTLLLTDAIDAPAIKHTSSFFKTLLYPIQHPLSYIEVKSISNAKISIYNERNRKQVVIPFLDALGVQYCVLSNSILLVNSSSELIERLEHLAFIPIEAWAEGCSMVKEYLKRTEMISTMRLYQPEYNIELYMIGFGKWDKLMLAAKLADGLNVKEEQYLKTYLSLYESLFITTEPLDIKQRRYS